MSFAALKSNTTKPYCRQQSWEVVRCYLSACLGSGDDRDSLLALLKHPSFREKSIPQLNTSAFFMSRHLVEGRDAIARKTHQTALTSKFLYFYKIVCLIDYANNVS